MKNDKTTKLLLTVIAVALVGNLLRPLLDTKPAWAQTATVPPSFPTDFSEVKYNTPYVSRIGENHVVLWYVQITNAKELAEGKIAGNVRIVQADYEVLH